MAGDQKALATLAESQTQPVAQKATSTQTGGGRKGS